MNIGIIGANGFIGSHLCATQLREGCSVFAICNKNSGSVPEGCTIVSLMQAGKINFDQLFIAIGNHSSTHTVFLQQNIFLYEIITTLKFRRIIFISSIAVYGNHSATINTDSCYSNPSLYGLAKLAQEFIVKSCADYVIIRPTYIYGNGMAKNSLLPILVQQAISFAHVKLYGDGTRKQDYLHVNDLVDLCVIAGNKNGSHTVIAATGNSITNTTLAEKIVGSIPATKIEYSGADYASSFEFDVSKTIDLYQWHPLTDFETGLKNYIQHANIDI